MTLEHIQLFFDTITLVALAASGWFLGATIANSIELARITNKLDAENVLTVIAVSVLNLALLITIAASGMPYAGYAFLGALLLKLMIENKPRWR